MHVNEVIAILLDTIAVHAKYRLKRHASTLIAAIEEAVRSTVNDVHSFAG